MVKYMTFEELVGLAASEIVKAKSVIALTGAGISVDSGIPDFRSAGGLWSRYDPNEYANIDAFLSDPDKIWNMIREMIDMVGGASPNPGHIGLAELEKMDRLDAIITQNVDNLHQEAGSSRVIEFHGSNARLVCLNCGESYETATVAPEPFPPRCKCDAILKPDVVFFGEAIPYEANVESQQLAASCDVLLVIGTSALVSPASYIPSIAKQAGATVIEINLEETGLTSYISDFIIKASSSEALPKIVEQVAILKNQ
jgi:NAD-dependent deacetylase